MERLVGKLEGVGLKKFINTHRHKHCEDTVNPREMAAFLRMNVDQIETIMDHSGPFAKCFKLYEYIEKMARPSHFLQALENTSNHKVIEFIELTVTGASNYGRMPVTSTGIWFNIPEPIDSFCGREDFLTQLHDHLRLRGDCKKEVTVLSQVKIVAGLGGIGKTETALRYISKYFEFYNNIIWINAEDENSMKTSFLKLVDEIKIPVEDSRGSPKGIDKIVKDIYSKICEGGKSNLIIFDNAENYKSCKNFFPFGLHPSVTKPVILATSRNQEWTSPHGKITVLPLDVLTDAESLDFILKELEIEDSPEFRQESREFIQLLGGLPLALQQSVAYVKHQKKVNGLLSRPYKVSDYCKKFKSNSEKLQNFSHAQDASTTIFVTWNLTLEKMKEDPEGEIAIEIIEAMSFLYADRIPVEFLFQLLPLPPLPQTWLKWGRSCFRQRRHDLKSTDFLEGLSLLQKFSMIKTIGNFVSIHRQVQFVIIQNFKSSGRLIELFNHLMEKCQVVLTNTKVSDRSDIFLNVHHIVNNQFDLIPVSQRFRDFMSGFGGVLLTVSDTAPSLDVLQKVGDNTTSLREWLSIGNKTHPHPGVRDMETQATQNEKAQQQLQLGMYDESINQLKETLKKQKLYLGMDHPETIVTKYNTASALQRQKKYQESLKMFQQLLDQSSKIHRENHPLTLRTQMKIASLYSKLGHLSQALVLFEQVECRQTQVLGSDHRDVLRTKHNKAQVLLEMGHFQEASRIFNNVYEKQKQILGEQHLSTIHSLASIAAILVLKAKFTEALEMYKKVHVVINAELGEHHPQTINVVTNIVNIQAILRETNVLL